MIKYLLLTINLLSSLLVRPALRSFGEGGSFASYARLGPSANRRRALAHRGLAGRPVTQQMSKRTTKNKKSIRMEVKMQNKPNFMRFCAVNDDCEEKQTQSNPIQTQNKAIFTTKNQPQTQYKPNQTQIFRWPSHPNSPFRATSHERRATYQSACGITKFRKAKNNKYETEKYNNELTKTR